MAKAHRKPAEPVRIDIKKEDTVKVISGRDKGKTGRVLRVDRETGKILVEHVMMIKRHTRPNPVEADQGRHRRARKPDRGLQRPGGLPGLQQGGPRGPSHGPDSRRQVAAYAGLPQVRPDPGQEVAEKLWRHV